MLVTTFFFLKEWYSVRAGKSYASKIPLDLLIGCTSTCQGRSPAVTNCQRSSLAGDSGGTTPAPPAPSTMSPVVDSALPCRIACGEKSSRDAQNPDSALFSARPLYLGHHLSMQIQAAMQRVALVVLVAAGLLFEASAIAVPVHAAGAELPSMATQNPPP